MPITDIVVLVTIIVAFAVFGLVLAWGDYQTRKPVRHVRPQRDGSRARATPSGQAATIVAAKSVRSRELTHS